MTQVLELFKQPSTWKGIISILTALGVSITPDLASAIVSAGFGFIGIIQVFVDKK